MSDKTIKRDDIRNQLTDISDGAAGQAEEAKTQLSAAAPGLGLQALTLFFFLGRKNGLTRSPGMSIRRA